MTEPKIAFKKPAIKDLQPGAYFWCACGLSNNQPFCDGSHKGTELRPIRFDLTEPKQLALCQCKRSKNKYLCDGTHAKL